MKVQPNVLRLQLCLSKKCHWSKAYSVQQLCVNKVSIWFQHFYLLLHPIVLYLIYLFVWRGFMEANTYHPILNISVVPRRYFSFTDLMFTVHSTITIIGSIDTYINVAKMSQKALHCIAMQYYIATIVINIAFFRSHHLAESVQRRLREQDSHLKQVVFHWVPTIWNKLILNNSIIRIS